MKQFARLFMSPLVAAFMFASVAANPAMAQEKAKAAKMEPTVKVLLENDKVRVTETTWKPGDATASIALFPFAPSRRRLPQGALPRASASCHYTNLTQT